MRQRKATSTTTMKITSNFRLVNPSERKKNPIVHPKEKILIKDRRGKIREL
jgi:hypothetical protein